MATSAPRSPAPGRAGGQRDRRLGEPGRRGTWAFVGNGGGISGLKLAIYGSGNPSLTMAWKKTIAGSSPLVANNVLHFASS